MIEPAIILLCLSLTNAQFNFDANTNQFTNSLSSLLQGSQASTFDTSSLQNFNNFDSSNLFQQSNLWNTATQAPISLQDWNAATQTPLTIQNPTVLQTATAAPTLSPNQFFRADVPNPAAGTVQNPSTFTVQNPTFTVQNGATQPATLTVAQPSVSVATPNIVQTPVSPGTITLQPGAQTINTIPTTINLNRTFVPTQTVIPGIGLSVQNAESPNFANIAAAQMEYRKIVQSNDLPRALVKDRVRTWAGMHGISAFMQEMAQQRAEALVKLEHLISEIPPALRNLRTIYENDNLSRHETMRQVNAVEQTVSLSTAKVFRIISTLFFQSFGELEGGTQPDGAEEMMFHKNNLTGKAAIFQAVSDDARKRLEEMLKEEDKPRNLVEVETLNWARSQGMETYQAVDRYENELRAARQIAAENIQNSITNLGPALSKYNALLVDESLSSRELNNRAQQIFSGLSGPESLAAQLLVQLFTAIPPSSTRIAQILQNKAETEPLMASFNPTRVSFNSPSQIDVLTGQTTLSPTRVVLGQQPSTLIVNPSSNPSTVVVSPSSRFAFDRIPIVTQNSSSPVVLSNQVLTTTRSPVTFSTIPARIFFMGQTTAAPVFSVNNVATSTAAPITFANPQTATFATTTTRSFFASQTTPSPFFSQTTTQTPFFSNRVATTPTPTSFFTTTRSPFVADTQTFFTTTIRPSQSEIDRLDQQARDAFRFRNLRFRNRRFRNRFFANRRRRT